jgi:DNA-binding NtrC family response regulator
LNIVEASAETRLRALGIVKKLGASADGVASAAQTLATLRERDVHLLVLDEVHPPADVANLQYDLATHHPTQSVLRIVPTDTAASDSATVPLDALDASLGSAVMFTLSNVI